jgi:hypothetical protein
MAVQLLSQYGRINTTSFLAFRKITPPIPAALNGAVAGQVAVPATPSPRANVAAPNAAGKPSTSSRWGRLRQAVRDNIDEDWPVVDQAPGQSVPKRIAHRGWPFGQGQRADGVRALTSSVGGEAGRILELGVVADTDPRSPGLDAGDTQVDDVALMTLRGLFHDGHLFAAPRMISRRMKG